MKTLKREDLTQFTGTNHWYRPDLNRALTYTDGVKYMAEAGEAFWLISEIALLQTLKKVKARPFQAWMLDVTPEHTATLSCEDGNGNVIHTKKILYTDFPLDSIEIWVVDDVMLLPSEY